MQDIFFLLISAVLLEGSVFLCQLIDLSVQLHWVPTGNRGNCVVTALNLLGSVCQLLSSSVSPLGNCH